MELGYGLVMYQRERVNLKRFASYAAKKKEKEKKRTPASFEKNTTSVVQASHGSANKKGIFRLPFS